jgi:hypothetical protein
MTYRREYLTPGRPVASVGSQNTATQRQYAISLIINRIDWYHPTCSCSPGPVRCIISVRAKNTLSLESFIAAHDCRGNERRFGVFHSLPYAGHPTRSKLSAWAPESNAMSPFCAGHRKWQAMNPCVAGSRIHDNWRKYRRPVTGCSKAGSNLRKHIP